MKEIRFLNDKENTHFVLQSERSDVDIFVK